MGNEAGGLPGFRPMWWLLGIVAAGFLSWSFAVFKATYSIELLADKMIAIEQELDKHQDRPWHNEAGHMIRLQSDTIARMETTQKQILKILRDKSAQ
jgi:hypothetical protein